MKYLLHMDLCTFVWALINFVTMLMQCSSLVVKPKNRKMLAIYIYIYTVYIFISWLVLLFSSRIYISHIDSLRGSFTLTLTNNTFVSLTNHISTPQCRDMLFRYLNNIIYPLVLVQYYIIYGIYIYTVYIYIYIYI